MKTKISLDGGRTFTETKNLKVKVVPEDSIHYDYLFTFTAEGIIVEQIFEDKHSVDRKEIWEYEISNKLL